MKKSVELKQNARTDEFHLEDFLPFRLSVAADAVSRLIVRQHLAPSGLAMPEWRLLAVVGRFGILSPTAAGERTAMDKVKISRAAASLGARGLLRQTQDPDDGRGRLLRLTRKGSSLYAGIVATAGDIESTLSSALTKAEWATLHKTLRKMSEHTQSILADGAFGAD